MSASAHADHAQADASASQSSASATSDQAATGSVTPVTETLDKLGNQHMPSQDAPKESSSVVATKSVALTSSTAPAPKDEGGLPQLDQSKWAGQIIWLVMIFVVFFVLMSRFFAPKIRHIIETRSTTISEDLANARAIRDEAEAQAKQAQDETKAAHAAARKLASEASAQAAKELAEAQAKEDARLNTVLGEAEGRIRAARDQAMSHVEDIASETASSLIEKLTGKPATKTALVQAFRKL